MVERLSVNIREATARDLPAMEWEGQYSHLRRLYRQALQEASNGRALPLVALAQDHVVGQLFVQFGRGSVAVEDVASINYLYSFRVRPSFRNQGISTQLLDRAEAELRERGFERAVIAVAMENEHARRLYERRGYRVFAKDPGKWSYVDHQGRLRHVSEPAHLLEKVL